MSGLADALRALWRPLQADEHRGGLRWFGVVAVLAFLLLLARRIQFVLQPQFWAEDGAVFFRDQLTLGFAGSLFETHAGYVLVVPRVIAAALSPLPAVHQPIAYTLVTSAMAALCCAWVVRDEHRRWLPSRRARAALALWLVCAPCAREVIGNLVNLQWYLIWLGFLFVAGALPARPAAQVAWSAALALIGASTPGAIVLVPLLGARAALSTSRRTRALTLLPTIPAIALALSGLSNRDEGPRPYYLATGLDVEDVASLDETVRGAATIVCRTLSEPILGELLYAQERLVVIRLATQAAPLAGALLVLGVIAIRSRPPRPGVSVLLALAGAAVVTVVGALSNKHDAVALVRLAGHAGPLACALFVLLLVVFAALGRGTRPEGRAFLAVGGAFLVLYLGALCIGRGHLIAVAARFGLHFGMGRYFFPTAAIVGAGLLVAASRLPRRARAHGLVGLGLLAAPAVVHCFRVPYGSDPTWPRSAAMIDTAIRERASRQLVLPVRPEPWALRLRIVEGVPHRDGSAWPRANMAR